MNAPKVTDIVYTQFLIAVQDIQICNEAAYYAVNASCNAYTSSFVTAARHSGIVAGSRAADLRNVRPINHRRYEDGQALYAENGSCEPPLEQQAPAVVEGSLTSCFGQTAKCR